LLLARSGSLHYPGRRCQSSASGRRTWRGGGGAWRCDPRLGSARSRQIRSGPGAHPAALGQGLLRERRFPGGGPAVSAGDLSGAGVCGGRLQPGAGADAGGRLHQRPGGVGPGERLEPGLLAPAYVRGIVRKRQGDFPSAITNLQRVVASDPACVGPGSIWPCVSRRPAALQCHRRSAGGAPARAESSQLPLPAHHPLPPARPGRGGRRHAEAYERVKDTQDEAEKTAEALERSRYSHILQAPSSAPAAGTGLEPPVRFVDQTREAGLTPPRRAAPCPRSCPRPSSLASTAGRPWPGATFPVWAPRVAVGDYDRDGRPTSTW